MAFNALDALGNSLFLAAGGIAADKYGFAGYLTNSIFVAAIVTIAILLFTRMATREMKLVPGGRQNFVEFVVEFLYNQVEAVVGKKVAPRAFPLLATLFIFILTANWFGLIPGVGTVGFGETSAFLTIAESHEAGHGGEDGHADGHAGAEAAPHNGETEASEDPHAVAKTKKEEGHGNGEPKAEADDHGGPHFTPLLRPATADLNMTLALAAVFMIVWVWITVTEVGVWGFIVHTFGPKGGLEGFLKYALIPIFLFVGAIEIISIAFRPLSLSFRLLGNIYAGETLLHTMGGLGATLGFPSWASFLSSIIIPLPFYFLEILVGLLQAIVFALLCAVYIQLSTSHEEEEH